MNERDALLVEIGFLHMQVSSATKILAEKDARIAELEAERDQKTPEPT